MFAVAAAASLFAPGATAAREAAAEIAARELPVEAQATLALIRKGGPFPYERDSVTFGNRERLLPPMPRGHYREYTVKTPGARDRGAQRIVCGGDVGTLAECYYSNDHYRSFKRIRP